MEGKGEKMETIRPPGLKKGDKVMVITPSEPIGSYRNFNRGVGVLKSLGFQVEFSKYYRSVYFYKAGLPEKRAEDINSAFANSEIKGVFMAAGGFSVSEVLPLLDYELIKNNPKVIMGFSNGTILSNAIFAKTGLVTFYGFCVEYFFRRKTSYTIDSFLNMASQGGIDFIHKSKWKNLRNGKIRGKLIGGNLTSFVQLIGTPYLPDLAKSILFLEEHDDWSQDVEAHLMHLRLSEFFELGMVQGVIFGKFYNVSIGSGDREYRNVKKPKGFTLYSIFKEKIPKHIPILANVDFGSITSLATIPIGVEAEIFIRRGQRPQFKLTQSAVI
jgi:muramoyltetrapeptide carboxypeptidase